MLQSTIDKAYVDLVRKYEPLTDRELKMITEAWQESAKLCMKIIMSTSAEPDHPEVSD